MTQPSVDRGTLAGRALTLQRVQRAAIEIAILAVLYVGYSASRLFASDEFAPARGRALDILAFEKTFRIDVESRLNDLFVQHEWLGLAGSYWYATTHYLITGAMLLWLYRRSHAQYVVARRTLVIATLVGLAFYLTVPTAPPRLVGYSDVLSMTSADGWWGADASAPKGMGGITNELAAFPSMHAGWAMWVALVLVWLGVPRWVQGVGVAYALVMTVDIIGTGNHWLLDAVAGWVVVLVVFGFVTAWSRRGSVAESDDGPPGLTAR